MLCCLFKACFPCLSHPITSSSVTREKALTYLIMESDRFQVNEGSSAPVGLLMLQWTGINCGLRSSLTSGTTRVGELRA